jgi:microcystin-dependent protein
MLFAQTAAPTGWTKSTTHDNKALRVVSGTASSGGTTAFTSVFASRTPSGTISNTTLTSNEIPSHAHGVSDPGHNHTIQSPRGSASGASFAGASFFNYASVQNDLSARAVASTTGISITATGGGNAHSHAFTGTALDFAVQYVDVILATKN